MQEITPKGTSRTRSFLRDLADGLGQWMYFWGCDARKSGNLLVAAGFSRQARAETGGEGSSLYVRPWTRGMVHLHSFHAGWAGPAGGVLFRRRTSRLEGCVVLPVPGAAETATRDAVSPDILTVRTRTFLRWMLDHEQRVRALAGTSYRTECWNAYGQLPFARPWLPPDEAIDWITRFLHEDPTLTRAKTLVRGKANKRTIEPEREAIAGLAEPGLVAGSTNLLR